MYVWMVCSRHVVLGQKCMLGVKCKPMAWPGSTFTDAEYDACCQFNFSEDDECVKPLSHLAA